MYTILCAEEGLAVRIVIHLLTSLCVRNSTPDVLYGRARPQARTSAPEKYIVSRQVSKVGSPLTLVASG